PNYSAVCLDSNGLPHRLSDVLKNSAFLLFFLTVFRRFQRFGRILTLPDEYSALLQVFQRFPAFFLRFTKLFSGPRSSMQIFIYILAVIWLCNAVKVPD